VFHTPVQDLFQVMETFSKVKDADGKMVGPPFKTMESEFVAWQQSIRVKQYDLCDEKKYDQPEGVFTERNMNRSQETWVKTFKMSWMKMVRFCLTTCHGPRRNCVRWWRVTLHVTICGASKSGYTTNTVTDSHNQM
jgi:hypothetical protein